MASDEIPLTKIPLKVSMISPCQNYLWDFEKCHICMAKFRCSNVDENIDEIDKNLNYGIKISIKNSKNGSTHYRN